MRHLDVLKKRHKPPPERRRFPHKNLPLTTRERQIILALSEGVTNKEIGRRLRLAEGTVKVHLHHIYRKLGIANRTALAVLAHTGRHSSREQSCLARSRVDSATRMR